MQVNFSCAWKRKHTVKFFAARFEKEVLNLAEGDLSANNKYQKYDCS